jgi:hypothetical protein
MQLMQHQLGQAHFPSLQLSFFELLDLCVPAHPVKACTCSLHVKLLYVCASACARVVLCTRILFVCAYARVRVCVFVRAGTCACITLARVHACAHAYFLLYNIA